MFQSRRRVFLFVCSIVFIQALYYIVTLQIKKNDSDLIDSWRISILQLTYNQSSDKLTTSVQQLNSSINYSNPFQVS